MFLVHAIVTLLFLQSYAKFVTDDSWDEADKLLQELKEDVEIATEGCLWVFEEEILQLNAYRERYSDIMNQYLNQTIALLNTEIEEIVEMAKNANVDITVCLEGRQEELQLLADVALDAFFKCDEYVGKHTLPKINALKDEVNGSLLVVGNLETALLNCTRTDIKCINGVIKDIRAADESIADVLINNNRDGNQYVTSWLNLINGCLNSELIEMEQEGQDVVDEIKVCADNIINL